jgi:hypothetical protein
MSYRNGIHFQSMVEFLESLPENERIMVDVLRQILLDNLSPSCKEKLGHRVPFYYGTKRICVIWPAAIKGGGIKEGVLLGFCQGYKLKDKDHYLKHGTNKQVFYRIYKSVDEINEKAIINLLKEAVSLDGIN